MPPLQTCGPSAALRPSTPLAMAGSATLLSHSSSQSGLWIPPYISGDRRYGSVSSAWTLCIAPPPRPSVCTVGSTSILVVASGHPPGGLCFHHALAPPSSNAAMECSLGCGLGLHLLKSPSWSSPPAPPLVLFVVLPVVHPPPEPPPASLCWRACLSPSLHHFLILLTASFFSLYGVRSHLPGGG